MVFTADASHDVEYLNPDDVGTTNAALERAYPWPEGRAWVRANMVVTVDGRAQSDDGLTEGISSPEDKFVFSYLRASCDAVLVGAGTVRSEGYRPIRPRVEQRDSRAAQGRRAAPVLAIVSGSLDFDLGSEIFTAPRSDDGVQRPLVVTSASADPARRRALEEVADVLICGDASVDPSLIAAALADHNLPRIVCEGGPHLLTDLLDAGAIDELDLTISPLLLMRPSGDLLSGAHLSGPTRSLHLAHILQAQSTLMLRYIVDKVAIPSL